MNFSLELFFFKFQITQWSQKASQNRPNTYASPCRFDQNTIRKKNTKAHRTQSLLDATTAAGYLLKFM